MAAEIKAPKQIEMEYIEKAICRLADFQDVQFTPAFTDEDGEIVPLDEAGDAIAVTTEAVTRLVESAGLSGEVRLCLQEWMLFMHPALSGEDVNHIALHAAIVVLTARQLQDEAEERDGGTVPEDKPVDHVRDLLAVGDQVLGSLVRLGLAGVDKLRSRYGSC